LHVLIDVDSSYHQNIVQRIYNEMQEYILHPPDDLVQYPINYSMSHENELVVASLCCANISTANLILRRLESYEGVNIVEPITITSESRVYRDWLKSEIDKIIAIAMSFPVAAVITTVIFIAIVFLINGIARIVEGFSSKHSGMSPAFLIGVGTMAVVTSTPLSISPLFFGSILAGTIIGIGAEMVFASQRKICRNPWPLIFNILYLVQYLLMNKKENKHEPSKQPSEDYHSGDNCRLHTEVIYCK
jgi:Short repeat of unknown function (DUF308)